MSREQEIEALSFKVQRWIMRAGYAGIMTWVGIFGVILGLFIGGFNPMFKAGVSMVIIGNLWAYFCIAGMVEFYNGKIRKLNNIQ